MANNLTKQIVEEGWRNAIVKLTGVLDSGNVSEAPAIALLDLMNNDVVAGKLIGLRVDHVYYAIGDGLEVQLAWHAATPHTIVALAGRGHHGGWNYGGWLPVTTDSGYTGDIDLFTTGYIPGSVLNFTVVLEMVKLYK